MNTAVRVGRQRSPVPVLPVARLYTALILAAGRRRFNVLAALNAITHELVMITNDTDIAADSVCDLLRRIAKVNLGVPITLVLDNARYQKCNIVTALALQLNIELPYLPTYSPNLNLIERLWKCVKKKPLYSKYDANFSDFRNAITDCLNQTHITHKQGLGSLLTLNFQTFKKFELVPI